MWFCATPTKSALQKQNKLNWKNPWRKTPTNAHRMLQELPSFSRCCGDDSLGSLAGKQVSQWHQHQVRWRSVCVCSHPFMCKCVTFQKKPSTIWTLLYWMCFQSGWWRVKQRLQQAGTTTETMPPTETPPPTCMRWRIITEFVFHTSVDQCLCAILLNSKMCIHLFNNVLHTSYIRQRRMFTACSEKGLLLLFLTCHRTCTVDRTSLTGNNFPLVNISTEIFTKHTRHNCCKYFLITLYTFIPHQWLKSDLNRILS